MDKIDQYVAAHGDYSDPKYDIAVLVRTAIGIAAEFLTSDDPDDYKTRALPRVDGFLAATSMATNQHILPEDLWTAAKEVRDAKAG